MAQALRARLRLSQSVFARALNVSPETIRAWEQGKRRPDGAALRLLQVAKRHPEAIVEQVCRRTASGTAWLRRGHRQLHARGSERTWIRPFPGAVAGAFAPGSCDMMTDHFIFVDK
jgi:transcriptional regulator with XRE-family HTH domain